MLYPSEANIREAVMEATSSFIQAYMLGPSDFPHRVWPPEAPWPREDTLTGCVTICGVFTGAVLVTCTRTFATRVATEIFDEVDESAVIDFCGELTNMMGGNIKAQFSIMRDSTCLLSLPIVAQGVLEVPDAKLLYELWLNCGEDRIGVAVLEHEAHNHPRPPRRTFSVPARPR